ncbi:MAG TPA: proline iminopeptidase-family hydrolase [Solirubrobacteraceae bacterium]|nr:proline iminopeptidase-family hydrolase [Solirubrobacteraceae bacterium]
MIEVPGGRVWCEAVGSRTDRPPLLCLHGGPGLPSAYLDTLRGLADERQVVLYDQLGCGRSDRPSSRDLYRAERFVEEVACVREGMGLERFHLLGQSWGGMLAVMFALTRPPGLVSLILASPVIDASRWVADCNRLKAQLPEEIRRTIDEHEAHGFTGCPEYAAATLEWWRRHVCRIAPFPAEVERAWQGLGAECYETMWGPSEFTCSGNLKDVALSSRLAEIDVPTLFTCGRHDEATPQSTGEFAQLVARARLVVFEASSHMAHLEEAEAYLACVREFLGHAERASSR